MRARITRLGRWSVKSYPRSDKCELVYVQVAFNIMDAAQRDDLEYVLDAVNRAGRIRECVRMTRLNFTHSYVPDVENDDAVAAEFDDDDILSALVD